MSLNLEMPNDQIREILKPIGYSELWDIVNKTEAVMYAKNGSTLSFHLDIRKALRHLAASIDHTEQLKDANLKLWKVNSLISCAYCGESFVQEPKDGDLYPESLKYHSLNECDKNPARKLIEILRLEIKILKDGKNDKG